MTVPVQGPGPSARAYGACIGGHALRGGPVPLDERDSDGYLVGYVNDAGLAWKSLR